MTENVTELRNQVQMLLENNKSYGVEIDRLNNENIKFKDMIVSLTYKIIELELKLKDKVK